MTKKSCCDIIIMYDYVQHGHVGKVKTGMI